MHLDMPDSCVIVFNTPLKSSVVPPRPYLNESMSEKPQTSPELALGERVRTRGKILKIDRRVAFELYLREQFLGIPKTKLLIQVGRFFCWKSNIVQVDWKPPTEQGVKEHCLSTMRAIFLVLYCISLFSSQLLSLPVSSSLWWNRSDFMTKIQQLKEVGTISPDVTGRQSEDRTNVWRVILSRPPPSEPEDAMVTSLPLEGESSESPKKRVVRGRRHVHSRGHHNHHHAQLMRVGCVLGTCQVQNLSHRLYQLVGQSGREDSPINPHSPHSYG